MLAKIFLLCAFVAAAHSTSLYGSGILAPGLYGSGILAPGLLNTVVAPGYAVKGAPLLSAPIAAAVPTAYTSKTVVTAPVTYAAKSVIAAPVAYAAKPVIAAPIAYAAPVAYAAKPVIAAPAAIATHRTVIGATSLLTGTPLIYNSGLYSNGLIGAAPLATGIVSPIGLKGAGLLAGPGVFKTILK